jgi:hypothetical protein
MCIRSLLAVLVLFAAAPAAAQQTRTFHSGTGLSLELPAQWTRVADEALEGVRREAARAGSPVTYEAGFSVSDAPFPAPPIVAVAWAPLPRKMTPREFGADFAADDAREEAQASVDETPAARLNTRVSSTSWDAENGIAWMRASMQSDGRTPAFSLMASTLHPSGDRMFALVYYGARGEDEARVRADLTAALRSLRAD